MLLLIGFASIGFAGIIFFFIRKKPVQLVTYSNNIQSCKLPGDLMYYLILNHINDSGTLETLALTSKQVNTLCKRKEIIDKYEVLKAREQQEEHVKVLQFINKSLAIINNTIDFMKMCKKVKPMFSRDVGKLYKIRSRS